MTAKEQLLEIRNSLSCDTDMLTLRRNIYQKAKIGNMDGSGDSSFANGKYKRCKDKLR